MATLKVGVTKETSFQGKLDEFSNIYTYTGDFPDSADYTALADAVVAAERTIFANNVTFKRVRVWGEDSIGRNVMLLTKDLLGTGSGVPTTGMYKECAIMLRWPLKPRVVGTGSFTNTFKRVSPYLRKYLHTGMLHGYDGAGAGDGFTPQAASVLQTYAQTIREPIPGKLLTNDLGDAPEAPHTFARWLEHRQFPRGRKEGS